MNTKVMIGPMVHEETPISNERPVAQNNGLGDGDYCEKLLRTHDPDRFYGLRYASKLDQSRLLGLYAMQTELRNIINVVSEAGLGEIRFQWWRETLEMLYAGDPARAHPVVQQLALYYNAVKGLPDEKESSTPQTSLKPVHAQKNQNPALDNQSKMLASIDARSRLLYDAPFETIEEFYQWAIKSEGYLDGVGAEHLLADRETIEAVQNMSALLTLARDVALANESARLAPHLDKQELIEFIKHHYEILSLSLGIIPPTIMPILLPASLIPIYLKSNNRAGLSIFRQVKYFKTILWGRVT